jgi:hypothetical protein
LAQAVQLYLNGDFSKLNGKEEFVEVITEDIADISCDPDQMMKQSQDVDEWLLSGVSDGTPSYLMQANYLLKSEVKSEENEDSMILKRLEEN